MSNGYFPVPDDAFASALPKTVGDYLVTILNWLWSQVARVSSGELHVYADGTNGDDSNDGLSASTPKKTLEAVLDLVPNIVRHNTKVHLQGTFTLDDDVTFTRTIDSGVVLVIDGGDNWQDTGAGVLTTTAGDATGIDVSGAGWTTDEHIGHFIKILTGDAEGEMRMVHSNDADTVEPISDFSSDPRGSGEATFQIVKPATTITSTGSKLQCCFLGHGTSALQRMTFAGNCSPYFLHCTNITRINVTVVEATGSLWLMTRCEFSTSQTYWFGDDFNAEGGGTGGVSFTAPGVEIRIWRCITSVLQGSVICGKLMVDGGNVQLSFGCRFLNGVDLFATDVQSLAADLKSASGWRNVKFSNTSGPGLLVRDGACRVGSQVECSDSSTFGVEVDGGTLRVEEVLAGTGNTTGGMYVHNGGKVILPSGKQPTLTGGSTVELSFDGTTQKATWATVDSTPQVESTTDLILAKAV